jgi:3-oxoacyl-[acyl-carrier-protein] synthase-3
MPARIRAIDYFLPATVETSEQLQSQNAQWDMRKFVQQTGIRSRCLAAPEETASDLGYGAARKLLDRGLLDVQEVDFLLFCTQSPDYFLPSGACILQDRLGLKKSAGALDFNLGCSGYVYGLCLASSLIESQIAHNVLLITADTMRKFVQPNDQAVQPLFGDGAAATLVSAASQDQIGNFVLGTDGAGADRLIVRNGGLRNPVIASPADGEATPALRPPVLFMDGPAVFTFTLDVVPTLLQDVLAKADWNADTVDWYVYHQANALMLNFLAAKSQIPPAKMVLEMGDIGNTVSSSIPIAIQRYVETGKIRPGQRLVLLGFGVGYSWGACTVTWTGDAEPGDH